MHAYMRTSASSFSSDKQPQLQYVKFSCHFTHSLHLLCVLPPPSPIMLQENGSGCLDTVGAIVVDQEGNVAAAVSSGGLAMKHPGRVGQVNHLSSSSPLPLPPAVPLLSGRRGGGTSGVYLYFHLYLYLYLYFNGYVKHSRYVI